MTSQNAKPTTKSTQKTSVYKPKIAYLKNFQLKNKDLPK